MLQPGTSEIVAIGNAGELLGWAVAGVRLVEAATADEVRETWGALDADVGLVVLTSAARAALPARLERGPLWVVLPT